MFGIWFTVGASPGACGLELASTACPSARTGGGTGREAAGLRALGLPAAEAVLSVDEVAAGDEADDLSAAPVAGLVPGEADELGGVEGDVAAGASDCARAPVIDTARTTPASSARAVRDEG
jgi:hypothetical protein